jgi:hypothetical protein
MYCSIASDEHVTCGKIKPLDVAAKGVKNATMLEDVASQVEYLIDTASKVREQRQKSKFTCQCFYQTKDLFIGPVFYYEIEFM